MRLAFTCLFIAAVGCGGSGSSRSNDDLSAKVDMALGGDLSATSSCAIGGPGCGTGMKCVPSMDSQNDVVGACAPNGTVALGQPCMQTNDPTELNDNCASGGICDNTGPDGVFVCRKICSADTDCTTAGDKCLSLIDPSFGWCLPSCTPFGTDCPAGTDCASSFSDIAATMSSSIGYFVCKKTGTGAAGADCNADTDCAAGLWCGINGCTPNCDSTHACPTNFDDAGALMCTSFSNLANGAGFCE